MAGKSTFLHDLFNREEANVGFDHQCLQKSHFSKMVDVLQPVLAAQPLDGPTKHSVLLLRVVV